MALHLDVRGSGSEIAAAERSVRQGRMPFRSIVAEPEQLEKLATAFDAAWIGVNSVHTIGNESQKRARARLAEIILDLWRADPEQPLSARAVERFRLDENPMAHE